MLDRILGYIGYKRSIENPSISLSDPSVWNELGLGGGSSSAGVVVNKETALTLDTVWRAVNLIAGTVGRLPCQVFMRDGKGWDVSPNHPAHRLLKRSPMPGMTPRTFKRLLTANALLHGAGYAYIQRNNASEPVELRPLDSSATYPVIVNGELFYSTSVGTKQLVLNMSEVLCIVGSTKDGWVPYSVFDKARESIGLGLATSKYSSVFFSNGAAPRVVIEVPNAMPPDKRMQFLAEWERMHKGIDNSHRTAILTNGAKVNAFSLNAEDSQLLETRRFTVREIANWFGVPAHKLQDTENASYNSLEQENQSFVDDSLEDWLVAWEEECEAKLLSETEKEADTHKVEFTRRRLVRAQLADRAQALSILVNARVLSPNEARAEEGWNPYPGGDEFLVPKNVNNPGGNPAATSQGEVPHKEEQDKSDDDTSDPGTERQAVVLAHRKLIVETAKRIIKRIGTHARRAAANPSKFMAWLDAFEQEHRIACRDMLEPVVIVACRGADVDDVLGQLFRSVHEGLLNLAGECKASELEEAVMRMMDGQETHGPAAIADLVLNHEEMCNAH
jgi:HK97 family phage portal protein